MEGLEDWSLVRKGRKRRKEALVFLHRRECETVLLILSLDN